MSDAAAEAEAAARAAEIAAAVRDASVTGTRVQVGKNVIIGSKPIMCPAGSYLNRMDVDWDGQRVGKVAGYCSDGTKLPTMGGGGAQPGYPYGYYSTTSVTSPTGWNTLPVGGNGSWVTNVGGVGGSANGSVGCGASGRKIVGYDMNSGWWLDSGGFWCDDPVALKAAADAAAAKAAAEAAASKAAAEAAVAKATADAKAAEEAAAAAKTLTGQLNNKAAVAAAGLGLTADDGKILGMSPLVFWFLLLIIFVIIAVYSITSKKKPSENTAGNRAT